MTINYVRQNQFMHSDKQSHHHHHQNTKTTIIIDHKDNYYNPQACKDTAQQIRNTLTIMQVKTTSTLTATTTNPHY